MQQELLVAPGVQIDVVTDPTVSFCLQQNSVPIIKRILLKNTGNSPLRDLEVRVSSEPAFAFLWTMHVASIGAGQQRTLDAVDLALSPEYLVSLTEATRGLLHVSVHGP